MVPPGDVFGIIPVWLAVYALSIAAFATAGYILYLRVFRFVLLGKDPDRFDQPVRRFFGALPYIFGQRKVLQSVSLRDRAGLAHFFIFWGFLSFTASYILYIFADSIWPQFSETILTDTGVRIFTAYLDILAVVFFVVLTWAAIRRWGIKPHRLSFDLTQKGESAIILLLIACLMLFTLLTEAFYVASGGHGPHADALIGRPLGEAFANAGIDGHLANALQGVFWWLHLAIILGFSLYIPLSKHMHIVAAPISFFTRKLDERGTLTTPDLEAALDNEEALGASKIQDFTWKELLDGYSCAVCGRCTDNCPANITGKILSPMHIVENMKEHVLEFGEGVSSDNDEQESKPMIGNWISEEALWDCVTCGACIQECPVGVEHIDSIVDMRRFLVSGTSLHARHRYERPSQHGAARTPLARHHLLPHRLGRRPERTHTLREAGRRGAVLGRLHRRARATQPERRASHGLCAQGEPALTSQSWATRSHAPATPRVEWATSISTRSWRSRTSRP